MIEENYGHWHLDFYCDESDFYTSATGFWNEEGSWDVFFNEYSNDELYKLFGGFNYEIDEDFGVLIFKAKDYDEAHDKFVKWVNDVLLPLLKKK
ncbi:hypothetical protein [Alkalihalobacterium alkalinitrilicum]|uniref:hypothetical protein n=1 Tax=Alkalihalobacterium alkalinitrilicum TaxID=427920 RepID=UPI000995B179|nr:hypothetical protein [Alkalihalobacterium alkalinitrilicum]